MKAKRGRVLLVVGLVGLLLLGLTRSASAQNDSEVVRARAAKKACALGDYEKGTEILADLFVTTDKVVYIYNQARCYQQNNLWERALTRFREFLRKAKNLTKDQRAEAEQNIAECEAALRQVPPLAPPAPVSPTPPRSEPPAPAPVPVPTVQGQATPATPVGNGLPLQSSATSDPGRGLRIAGLILAGVGGAAIGAGVFCTLKTRSISSNESKHGATQAQEDERKRYETWGWVSYGVGATALATGVILYIVGWPAADSGQVALQPRVSATGADLFLTGRF